MIFSLLIFAKLTISSILIIEHVQTSIIADSPVSEGERPHLVLDFRQQLVDGFDRHLINHSGSCL